MYLCLNNEFQIRGQGLIFIPRNLCGADVLSSRISPLAGREPEAGKTGRKILLSLIAPKTHIFS